MDTVACGWGHGTRDKRISKSRYLAIGSWATPDPMLQYVCCCPNPETSRPHPGSIGVPDPDHRSVYGVRMTPKLGDPRNGLGMRKDGSHLMEQGLYA